MKLVEVSKQNFQGIAFTGDGRYLVALHASGYVRFWEAPDFSERLTVHLPVIPSSRRLALLDRFILTHNALYDASEAWSRLAAGETSGKGPLVLPQVKLDGFHSDMALTVSAVRSEVIGARRAHFPQKEKRVLSFWDLDGRLGASVTMSAGPFEGNWDDMAVSPDGKVLGGAGVREATLVEIDSLDEQKEARTDYSHTDFVWRLSFSPKGRFLATAAGRSPWLWDLSGERQPTRFGAFRRPIECLAFHPSGNLFCAAGRDGEVRVYDTSAAKETMRLDLDIGAIGGVAFSPDGTTGVAAGRDRRLAVWDVD